MSSKKTSDTAFSARLRSAMEQRGISQAQLASKLGTSQSTVSGWLNRGSMPRGNGMLRLADAVEFPMLWLAHGEQGASIFPEGPRGSSFAQRELLIPTRMREGLPAEHPVPAPAQQHMISAVVALLQSVQVGELPLSELEQAQALLDMIHPPKTKKAPKP